MAWIAFIIPVVAVIVLLVFFYKKVVLWEICAVLIPSALLILVMNFFMIEAREADTEYQGYYISRVVYYESWDERVSCRHPIYCTRTVTSGSGKNRTTHTERYVCGHVHAYDVDFHPEHWTMVDNDGDSYEISRGRFLGLQARFGTKPYFVELNRHYHSKDGDAYNTEWDKRPVNVETITKSGYYKNKIQASHSIFKFEDIDDREKSRWNLYDYPSIKDNYQSCVLGFKLDPVTDRKFQYINAFYGKSKQFRLYVLLFKDQSYQVSIKQRSYWEGGNKNEMVVCIGLDKSGHYQWSNAFSWMDKPELEVRVEQYFSGLQGQPLNLDDFADWLPKQIETHWHRKDFADFDYIQVEVTPGQLTWIMIIILLYNIGISFWVVLNEFYYSDRQLNDSESHWMSRFIDKSRNWISNATVTTVDFFSNLRDRAINSYRQFKLNNFRRLKK